MSISFRARDIDDFPPRAARRAERSVMSREARPGAGIIGHKLLRPGRGSHSDVKEV